MQTNPCVTWKSLYVLKHTLSFFTIPLCEHRSAPRRAAAVVLQQNSAALDKTDGASSHGHACPRANQARRAGPQERRCRSRRGRKARRFPPARDRGRLEIDGERRG